MRIRLELPFADSAAAFAIASVEHWVPEADDGTGDIAVLRLDAEIPGARPLGMMESVNLWDHRVRVPGFPKGLESGAWHVGRLMGRTEQGWVQISPHPSRGVPIAGGFSGAPVWDEKLGGVVGIVVAAQLGGARQGFLIPTRTLTTAVPSLSAVVRPAPPVADIPHPNGQVDDAAQLLAKSLREQWGAEETLRRLWDPIPLPVRWRLAPDTLMDHWSNINLSLDGADPHPRDLAGQLHEIVEVYRRVRSGRLVVLGRAGSGKSVLAMRFVLDVLGPPGSATPLVPVILGLGSWDPTTPLRDWLVSQLERDHSGLAAAGPGTSTLAAALVDDDRVLPVLDGFDEIAEQLHRPALEALNDYSGPLLLTSRHSAYKAAAVGTDVLTSAAVVELTNLTPASLERYLPRTTRKAPSPGSGTGTPGETAWSPVLAHLRDHPQHPASAHLASVLRTPLMVALARTIYSDTPDHDPVALLDTNRFPTPGDLENHLLDTFVPALYRDRSSAYQERVLRWLGHLAQHLDVLGTRDGSPHRPVRDLAWWQLGSSLRLRSRIGVIGLVTGLTFGVVDGLVNWWLCWAVYGWGLGIGLLNGLVNGVSFGATSGLAFALVYALRHRTTACEPSQVRIRLRSPTRWRRGEVVRRLATGLAGGFGFGIAAVLLLSLASGFLSLSNALHAGLLYGLSAGVGYALSAGLEAPVDIDTAVSPVDLLHANRANALFQFLAFGVALATTGGILYGIGWFRMLDWIVYGVVGWLGGGLAYGLGLTAWGHWLTLSRLWLPLTGRLPWKVSAFLKDAHRRGVLRQAGAVYQFRHARLQDRLAASPPGQHGSPSPRASVRREVAAMRR